MIKKINPVELSHAKEIVFLQKQSFYIESQLIDYPAVVGLLEMEDDILKCSDTYLGYRNEQGDLLGILSYEYREEDVFIGKLAILPTEFRKGIATQLLAHFLQMNHPKEKITIETSTKNKPAFNLYQKFGFTRVSTYTLISQGKFIQVGILEKENKQ